MCEQPEKLKFQCPHCKNFFTVDEFYDLPEHYGLVNVNEFCLGSEGNIFKLGEFSNALPL